MTAFRTNPFQCVFTFPACLSFPAFLLASFTTLPQLIASIMELYIYSHSTCVIAVEVPAGLPVLAGVAGAVLDLAGVTGAAGGAGLVGVEGSADAGVAGASVLAFAGRPW